MNEKVELQKIMKQISEVENQRRELVESRGKAGRDVQELEGVLAREILADEKIDESARVVTREKARIVGIGNAIVQLDAQLVGLNAEKKGLEDQIACADLERSENEIPKKLFTVIGMLHDADAILSSIDPRPLLPPGYKASDEVSLARNMLSRLEQEINIHQTLIELDAQATTAFHRPDYFKKAKEYSHASQ